MIESTESHCSCCLQRRFNTEDLQALQQSSSRVRTLSNAPPANPHVAANATQTLEEAQAMLAEVDDALNQLQDSTTLLTRRKEGIQAVIDRSRCILSPIHSVLDDMLLAIFALIPDPPSRILPSNSKRSTPWALSQVSRRWRALAISCPSLWSNIYFDRDEIDLMRRRRQSRPSKGGIEELLKLQLERTGSSPLSIYLDFLTRRTKPHGFLASLLQTTHRWSEATLGGLGSGMASDIPELDFQQLQKLTLRGHGSFFLNQCFPSSPLRSLVMLFECRGLDAHWPAFKGLTRLDITLRNPAFLRKLLEGIPGLQDLTVREQGSGPTGEPSDLLPLTMLGVQHLHLVMGPRHSASPTSFTFLRVPNLSSLSLTGNIINLSNPVISLVTSSGCSVKSLSVQPKYDTFSLHTCMESLFSDLPGLDHFHLYAYHPFEDADHITEALSWAELECPEQQLDSEPTRLERRLCPQLSSLEVNVPYISPAGLLLLLQSRHDAGHGLKRVAIRVRAQQLEEFRTQSSALKDTGVAIEFGEYKGGAVRGSPDP